MKRIEHSGRLYYSYSEFLEDVKELHKSITGSPDIPIDPKRTVLVGIARGGLIPAVMLSNWTGLPLVPLRWSFRDGPPPLTFDEDLWLNTLSSYENILVVEDICDSGKTLNSLRYSARAVPTGLTRNIKFLCLWNNIRSGCPVWKYARGIDREVDKRFVVFPWE